VCHFPGWFEVPVIGHADDSTVAFCGLNRSEEAENLSINDIFVIINPQYFTNL
jgi:hypothetical protein